LVSASNDTTALVWDMTAVAREAQVPWKAELSSEEMTSLWADLGADVPKAYQSLLILTDAPVQTVPFLKERLKPVPAPDRERLARLVKELDGDDFETRQKAETELEKLGELASPTLRKALEGNPSLEMRRRAERLLQRAERTEVPGPEQMRLLRAVE